MVLEPEQGSRGRGGLPQMGARFRRRRQDHRRPALRRHAPGRGRRPICRSRSSATRRRNTTAPASSPPKRRAVDSTDVDAADVERAMRLKRSSARPICARGAGSGSSTTPDPGQYGAARRAAMPASCACDGAEGPRVHLRRDAALLRGRPFRGRQAGGRRSLAQPHRGRREPLARHRQPQFRQSRTARDHGPVRRAHERHRRGLPRARFPDRLGQCLALQRDQRPSDPADADHRRRRPDRRRRRSHATLGLQGARASDPA